MSIDHNRIKVADLEKNLPNKILTTNNNGELEFSDSYNGLDCTVAGKVLDARQGKVLKDLVDNINALLTSDNINLNTIQELVDNIEDIQVSLSTILVNDLVTGGTTKALTAEMGKLLQNTKVDKVTGKSLLSDTEITRLGSLSNYTHPVNHPPSIIIQDTNNRFVTDEEKATWDHSGLYSLLAHTHTFASLTSKPTTLSGYGITDAELSFSKNTAFNKNFGTITGTVAEGNDSRILNGQTAFGWGNHAGIYLPLTGGTLTGSLDVRVGYSFFGSQKGYTYINEDQINSHYSTNGNENFNINYTGYNGGTTRFRGLNIWNGKASLLLGINGITGTATFSSTVTAPRSIITGFSDVSGPTLGSSSLGQHAILSGNGLYGMYTGISSNGDVWQQVQRNDGVASTYNLLLNPLGGKIGVGTLNPINLLNIVNPGSQNDVYGNLQIGYSGTVTTINSGLTVKSYMGTSQFMQWSTYGLRFGSRIITNGGSGSVYMTYGNDSVGLTILGSNGNIGIGTDTPTFAAGYKTLALNGAAGSNLELKVADASALRIFSDSAQSYLYEARNSPVKIYTNGLERFTINGNGGINIANWLDVMNTIYAYGGLSVGTAGSRAGALAGSNAIAIGDNDTGFIQNGDGLLQTYANNILVRDDFSGGSKFYVPVTAPIFQSNGYKFLEMRSNSADRGPWNPIISSIRNSGKGLYWDEDFSKGGNSIAVYNNSGPSSGMTHVRVNSSLPFGVPPNSSGYVIKGTHTGGGASSPGFGGFIHTINAAENKTFVQIFQALLPIGRNFVIAENYQGDNYTSYWLTNVSGTGKFEWYARVSHCGDGGGFNGGGHVYIEGGPDTTFDFYLASCNVYDVTNTSELNIANLTANSGDFSIKSIDNGTAAGWRGRMGTFNSDANRSTFLGTYGGNSVVGAHNNALTSWADLFVNTVNGTDGGDTRFSNARINSNGNILGTNFIGAGTGLTGTAAGLSIGGDSGSVGGISANRIVYGGAGRASTYVGSFNDANQKSGFYYHNAAIGAPDGDWQNWMTIAGNDWQSSNNYAFQISHAFHSDNFYVRRTTNGGPAGWRTLMDSGNIGSQSVSYASSAGTAGAIPWTGVSSKPTTLGGYGITDALPLSGGNMSGNIGRTSHSSGFLVGSYNSVGSNDSSPNPIYTIGSSYMPTNSTLGSMYGIGYSHENFWGVNKSTGWGLYVSEAGLFKATISSGGIWSIGTIKADGDIIAYSASDRRFKDNIVAITNPIDKINKIGGYTFDWNDKQTTYTGHDVGVIAQEIELILPELVITRSNGYKSVKYDKLVALLIEGIKEQQKQIDELRKLINK